MKNIVPITDLQRQAGQIVSGLADSDEPVVITQRGRAAAVIVSASRYAEIEEDLRRLDELELLEMVDRAHAARAAGETIPHAEVKRRLGAGREARARRSAARRAR